MRAGHRLSRSGKGLLLPLTVLPALLAKCVKGSRQDDHHRDRIWDPQIPMSQVGERDVQSQPAHREVSMPASSAVGTRRAALMLVALSAAGALAGCGGGGQSLTASEFVSRINDEGVTMRLGRQLPTSGDADQLYAVRLPPLPGEPPPPAGSEGGPGATGTLYVYGDSGAAGDQLRGCRASGGLVCFQASNIVVVLDEEAAGLEARRLGVAIRRMADA
jgi:hypothetical protein